MNHVNAPLKSALIDLLYRLADDSLIIGHRNSEWTGIGPVLEEDIAFSSMAQDKIGHAVAYYNLLHELGEPDPDDLAYARPIEAFRCCTLVALEACAQDDDDARSADFAATRPSSTAAPRSSHGPDNRRPAALSNNPERDHLLQGGDWAKALVRQFFYSEADALRLAALEDSTYEPLAALARKLRGEVKYHVMHGRTLIDRLGRGTDGSRRKIQHAVDDLYPHALGMFEASRWDGALEEHRVAPAEMTLCERWRAAVLPLLAGAGLEFPNEAQPIYGGRAGRHPRDLYTLLQSMRRVRNLDPAAQW